MWAYLLSLSYFLKTACKSCIVKKDFSIRWKTNILQWSIFEWPHAVLILQLLAMSMGKGTYFLLSEINCSSLFLIHTRNQRTLTWMGKTFYLKCLIISPICIYSPSSGRFLFIGKILWIQCSTVFSQTAIARCDLLTYHSIQYSAFQMPWELKAHVFFSTSWELISWGSKIPAHLGSLVIQKTQLIVKNLVGLDIMARQK